MKKTIGLFLGLFVICLDGLKFVLVIFTENFANERDIIPGIAGSILKNLASVK